MRNIKADTLVVTATLGCRDSLDRTIRSVKENGGDRVNHVITCPGNILKNLKKKYPFLEVIPEPEEKNGIYSALNNVIRKYAKDYKYVTFINDDDYWLPGFKKLFLTLDGNQELDAVYGKTLFVSEDNKTIGEQTSSPRYKSFKVLLTRKVVLFTQQATLIKSQVFYKTGGFDENYKLIADSKFWVEAIALGVKFHYINILAAAYTLQEGQLSSDKRVQNEEYTKLLNENFFQSISLSEVIFENLIFRLYNTSIYFKRIFQKFNIIN